MPIFEVLAHGVQQGQVRIVRLIGLIDRLILKA